MKNLILLLCICCASCTSATVDAVAGTDSLVIQFVPDDPGMLPRTVATTSPAAIHRLTDFINKKEVEPKACAYTGNVWFYGNNKVLLQASFSDKEGCRYFTYTLNGAIRHTHMNHEAVDFLKSLETGKNFY